MIFPEAKPLTEPFSFIFLKRLCSLSIIKHINYGNIAIRICSIIPINCNYSSNILSVDYVDFNSNLNYTNPEPKQCETTGPIINSYVPHICKNGGESYYYTFDYLMENRIVITPNITEAYLDGFKIDKVYPSSGFNLISIIPLFIVNEQAAIVYYLPIINKLASILSRISGFFSFLSGVFVFLFGATKLAPWGFLQTYVFNYLCMEFRRKLVRKLKNKYEPISFISGRTKNGTLEGRVQNIENMLLVEDNNKVNNI
ncbi:unnamed protein product [Rhizophagus irregularis]|nr:unnamed protein product [Rhizophagus irregularis]